MSSEPEATTRAAQAPASGEPAGYRVKLDAFAGPLDLLLHLVKRHEIDLHDIPVAELTDQYLAYLERGRGLDVEQAGEFLVMAATLLEIKAKVIAPRPEEEEGEPAGQEGGAGDAAEGAEQSILPAQEADPRYELVQQLLAYQAFRDAAAALDARHREWSVRSPAQAGVGEAEQDDEAKARQFDLDDANVADLAEAMTRVMETIGTGPGPHQVEYDDTPISLHAEDIVDHLRRSGAMTLRAVFEGRKRGELVGLFLATLELVRQSRVRVRQDAAGGDISLELREPAEGDADADAPASDAPSEDGPLVMEDYDWPDEDARKAMERRVRLREKRAAGEAVEGEAEPSEEDDDVVERDEIDEIDVGD